MTTRRIGAALGALMVAAGPAVAQAQPVQQDAWRFALTPYIWFAGIGGEATLPRQSRDFDADFGDVLSNLDLAAMAMFEARRGRFSLVVDGLYLGQDVSVTTPRNLAFRGGRAELDATQLAAVGLVRAIEQPGFGLDVGAGMRAWWIDTEVTLNPGLAAGRSAKGSANFTDPILAMRAEVRLSERWSFSAYGDIGGFNTGSRLTWQVLGAVSWQATQNTSLQLGYRHLAVDFSRGDLALDLSFGGPILGATIRF
jgi:opacity protein-like surface antigen